MGRNKEISAYNFVEIGNHSHTHEYLIDFTNEEIKEDLQKSINIFKKELGKNSIFFHTRLENIVKI